MQSRRADGVCLGTEVEWQRGVVRMVGCVTGSACGVQLIVRQFLMNVRVLYYTRSLSREAAKHENKQTRTAPVTATHILPHAHATNHLGNEYQR